MKNAYVGLAILLGSAAPCSAAMDFYDSSSRTIYVAFEQPVGSVAVHLTGNTITGGCVPPRSLVKVMNFIPPQTVRNNASLVARLQSSFPGLSADISASSASTATSTRPAVFSYNYTGTVRNLHYNTVYTRNGTSTARGWRPDAGGGCTYTIN